MQNCLLLKSVSKNLTFISSLSSSTVKPSLLSRLRYVLNHYWLGSKLLYQNFQSIKEIKKKEVHLLTRVENLSLNQFRYDIRVGVPFVLLFAIPIVGYSAPLLALLAPKYLPSTLIMPKQTVKFLNEDANASKMIIPSLQKQSERQFTSESISGMIPIMQLIDQVNQSDNPFHLLMASIPQYSSLFDKSYRLSQLPREHLLILHQSVLHSSFLARYCLPRYSLISELEMWEYRTFIDDQQLDHIDQLSPYMLASCLYYRGLYLHSNEMGKLFQFQQTNLLNQINRKDQQTNEQLTIDSNIINDWKQLLKQWITLHQKLAQTNPISTTFLLHIAPLLAKQSTEYFSN